MLDSAIHQKIAFQKLKRLETNIYFLMPIVPMLALARTSYFMFALLLGMFCQEGRLCLTDRNSILMT